MNLNESEVRPRHQFNFWSSPGSLLPVSGFSSWVCDTRKLRASSHWHLVALPHYHATKPIYWVTLEAPWPLFGLPGEKEEEGRYGDSRTFQEDKKDDWSESRALPLTAPGWENTNENDYQDARKEKLQTKEWWQESPWGEVLHVYWAGKDCPQLKSFPMGWNKNAKRKRANGKSLCPNVHAQGETEVWKVFQTGKRNNKAWKRLFTKVCFPGNGFLENPLNMRDFRRPMGLHCPNAHATHSEWKATFHLPIAGVKNESLIPATYYFGCYYQRYGHQDESEGVGHVTQEGERIWGKHARVPMILKAIEAQRQPCWLASSFQ